MTNKERTKKRTETRTCDLIGRQAAIDALVNCTNCGDETTLRAYVAKHNLDNGWTGGILEAIDAIEDLPSAQPEIIHCRECKHWKTDHPTANGYHCCHRIHNAFPMREDDFCSRAERREE